MNNEHENIILILQGDLLSVFNAMWLSMDILMLSKCELFGLAVGISFMYELSAGKRQLRE